MHIFSTKNNSLFVLFTFEILTNDIVNFKQLAQAILNPGHMEPATALWLKQFTVKEKLERLKKGFI